MFSGIGPWEILLIFLVVLLLFGAKRIPEIAKGLGKGITEFKRGMQDVKDEIETSMDSPPRTGSQNTSSPNTKQPDAAQSQPSDSEAGKPT